MAKETNRESSKAGTINICNTTDSLIDIGLRRHNREPGKGGPAVELVSLLPGNNTIDATKWAECKKLPRVQMFMSMIDTRDRSGRIHQAQSLIENHYDKKFASVTKDLAQRITDNSRARMG